MLQQYINYFLDNTILFYHLNPFNFIFNNKIKNIQYFSNSINWYVLKNNCYLDENFKFLLKKQLKHLQLNQFIIIEFPGKNYAFLDCYNSFTTKDYYKNNLNYYISNYTYNGFKNNQYINSNGCLFIYNNLDDYFNNNLFIINKEKILDKNYIKYFNDNKKTIIEIMIKQHYEKKIKILESLKNINEIN